MGSPATARTKPAFLGSGWGSPPAGRVDQSSVYNQEVSEVSEMLLSTCRGPRTAHRCNAVVPNICRRGSPVGKDDCGHSFKVFLTPDRFPSLRRLANGYGQGASTRLVLGTRGLKRGPEFPPRIARSRGIIVRVLSGLGVPPKDRLFCGGCVSVVVITF